MNENKIPCGGFRIGDGLTMEGDTLKSLSGAYVKIKSDDGETFEFMDDSPLKTYDEIRQKMETSVVTLLLYTPDYPVRSFFLERYHPSDGLVFRAFLIGDNILSVVTLSIDSDNKITVSESSYTLTPAT